MDPQEKYIEIPKVKDLGTKYFKKGDFFKALKEYERALHLLDSLNNSNILLI